MNENHQFMDDFLFDVDAAARIAKVVRMYPMTLENCADILEAVAPLCEVWTARGFLLRLHRIKDSTEAENGQY